MGKQPFVRWPVFKLNVRKGGIDRKDRSLHLALLDFGGQRDTYDFLHELMHGQGCGGIVLDQ